MPSSTYQTDRSYTTDHHSITNTLLHTSTQACNIVKHVTSSRTCAGYSYISFAFMCLSFPIAALVSCIGLLALFRIASEAINSKPGTNLATTAAAPPPSPRLAAPPAPKAGQPTAAATRSTPAPASAAAPVQSAQQGGPPVAAPAAPDAASPAGSSSAATAAAAPAEAKAPSAPAAPKVTPATHPAYVQARGVSKPGRAAPLSVESRNPLLCISVAGPRVAPAA